MCYLSNLYDHKEILFLMLFQSFKSMCFYWKALFKGISLGDKNFGLVLAAFDASQG